MTDYDALAAAFTDAADAVSGVSHLFNNAGGGFLSPVDEFPLDEWRRIVDLNLTGVFHGIRAGSPSSAAAAARS